MKNFIVIATLLLATSTASADKPTLDEVKKTMLKFHTDVLDMTGDSAKAPNAKGAIAVMSDAFWYDGFEYSAMDEATMKACKKKWSAKGTVKAADLPAFLDCAAIAMWAGALDGDAEWSTVQAKKLPAVFKKHKTKLGKLEKDHVLVMSHFVPAGPAESWNLYAATKDASGTVKLAAFLTVNKIYAE